MNVVMIVPTGIGCEIGGHAGDATPAARLLAGCCSNLILHPNVVNASDINEMPKNAWYVEGSLLDRFLREEFGLRKVRANTVLVATNPPLKPEVVNSVSAARATLGLDAYIVVLKEPLRMIGRIEDDKATGDVYGWRELANQVSSYNFDALAIASYIEVDRPTKFKYFREGGINPWGGVEARASKLIATALLKPVAHAPCDATFEDDPEWALFSEVVDPRMSAELVSISYLHCILKGLHKAPQITKDKGEGLWVKDVDCMVSPLGCFGPPHVACVERNIPIIVVKENKTCLDRIFSEEHLEVENYLEAAGMIVAMRDGINWKAVRRPLKKTHIETS